MDLPSTADDEAMQIDEAAAVSIASRKRKRRVPKASDVTVFDDEEDGEEEDEEGTKSSRRHIEIASSVTPSPTSKGKRKSKSTGARSPPHKASSRPQSSAGDFEFVGSDDEGDVPWGHLLIEGNLIDGKPMELSKEGQKFWTDLEAHCPEQYDFATDSSRTWGFIKDEEPLKKKGMPIDFASIREFLVQFGQKRLDRLEKEGRRRKGDEITGEEAIDEYFQSGTLKRAKDSKTKNKLADDLMRQVNIMARGSAIIPAKSRYEAKRVIKNLKRILPEFERKCGDRYERLGPVDSDDIALPQVSRNRTSAPPMSIENASGKVQARLKEFQAIVQQLDQVKQPERSLQMKMKTVVNAIEKQKDAVQDDMCVYDDAPSVALLGITRSGKSFVTNQMIRATIVPDRSYNLRLKGSVWTSKSPPTAESAARVVARAICVQEDSHHLSETGKVAATEVRDERFYNLVNEIMHPVDVLGIAQVPDSCVDDVPFELIRQVPSEHPQVYWRLPLGQAPESEESTLQCIFNSDGSLNELCSDPRYLSEKQRLEATASHFQEYITGKRREIEGDDGDFMVPALSSTTAVTPISIKISGGEQTSLIMTFVGVSHVDELIADIEAEDAVRVDVAEAAESVRELIKQKRERLIEILATLRFGPEKRRDPECEDDDDDPREDWVYEARKNINFAIKWWKVDVPASTRAFVKEKWFDRFKQWMEGRSQHAWGAYTVFTKIRERDELVQALAFLTQNTPEKHDQWCKKALQDDDFAFGWLNGPEPTAQVRDKFKSDFRIWRLSMRSRSAVWVPNDVPRKVAEKLERLAVENPREIGMNYAQAQAALEKLWLQEANNFCEEARQCFDATLIYQGAGQAINDDLAFLKVEQNQVLQKDSVSSTMLAELQWSVPSRLFATDSFACLVDTPGLNDVDSFKKAQTRTAVEKADTVVVFSDNHLSISELTLKKMNEIGVTKEIVSRQVEGVCGKRVLILLNLENNYKVPEKPRALPASDEQSVLYKDPKSPDSRISEISKNAVTDSIKSLKTEIMKCADENGVIAGLPQIDDCRHPRFDRKVLSPMVRKSQFVIWPALCRGLIEADPSMPDREDMINETNMLIVIREVFSALQESTRMSYSDAHNLLKKCEELDERGIAFKAPELNDVPPQLTSAAQTWLEFHSTKKGGCVKHGDIRKAAEHHIKTYFQPLKEMKDGSNPHVVCVQRWAEEQSDGILRALAVHIPHQNGCYAALRQQDVQDEVTFNSVVRAIVYASDVGLVMCDDEILSREFWKCTEMFLRHEYIWDTGDNACLRTVATECFAETIAVYAPDVLERLEEKLDSGTLSVDARQTAETIIGARLPIAFEQHLKIADFENRLRNKFWHAKVARTMKAFKSSRDTVARVVLDKLGKLIFEDFPEELLQSGANQVLLAKELDSRFTRENLMKHKQKLVTLFREQFSEMVTDMESKMIFWYGWSNTTNAGNRKNGRGSHVKNMFKNAFELIATTKKVGDHGCGTSAALHDSFCERKKNLEIAVGDLLAAENSVVTLWLRSATEFGHLALTERFRRFGGQSFEEANAEIEAPECLSLASMKQCTTSTTEDHADSLRQTFEKGTTRMSKVRAEEISRQKQSNPEYSELPLMKWSDYDWVCPAKECVGEFQLASLVSTALDAAPEGGAPASAINQGDLAHDVHERLSQGCAELQEHDVTGMINVLAKLCTATVYVHVVVQKSRALHVWKAHHTLRNPAREFVLRFVYDDNTHRMFLLAPKSTRGKGKVAFSANAAQSSPLSKLSKEDKKRLAKTRPDLATLQGEAIGYAIMAESSRGANVGPHAGATLPPRRDKKEYKGDIEARVRQADQEWNISDGAGPASAANVTLTNAAETSKRVAHEDLPSKKQKRRKKPTGWS